MNLADPELELIDPTPNIHLLFIQFDQTFFSTKLASRAVVRWSKRMYSCAGVCSYEGRGGLCDIALSEPLLKLRPRKDLVETLLHEMIHAFLFVTCKDQDRDGHGPNFKAHMHRINNAAGLKISIYHDFHEEVQLYQTHWWRCNGPCQTRKPHFGICRRSTNVAPGPRDYWWSNHQRKCGGTFIKFKEPEKKGKKAVPAKPPGDIMKYVNVTKKTPPEGEPRIIQVPAKNTKPVLTKSNSSSTVVATKGVSTINTPIVKPPASFTGKGHKIPGSRVRSSSVDVAEAVRNVWANKRLTATFTPISSTGKVTSQSNNVQKQNTNNKTISNNVNNNSVQKATKHKANSVHTDSPPVKVKKIDDYFKTTATSLLKDIYGGNIIIAESKNNNKLIAVHTASASNLKVVQVDCPICKLKIDENLINTHLDECLNKDIISKLCTSNEEVIQPYSESSVKIERPIKVEAPVKVVPICDKKRLSPILKPTFKDTIRNLPPIPAYRGKIEDSSPTLKPLFKDTIRNLPSIPAYRGKIEDSDGSINYTMMRKDLDRALTTFRGTSQSNTDSDVIKEPNNLDDNLNWEDVLRRDVPKTQFDPNDVDKVKSVVKKIEFDKHLSKSNNFVVVKEEKDLESGFLPSFIDENARAIKLPPVKLEPGTSVIPALTEHKCPCCGSKVTKAIDEHLDECLAFLVNDTEPVEGASTSFANHTIVIDDDDDDIFDESQLLNATGTKLPCPCCLKMVENDDMNAHLDTCLS